MNKLERIREDMEEKYGPQLKVIRPKVIQPKDRTTYSFYLDINLMDRFKEQCKDEDRFISRAVEKALEGYLKNG